MQRLLKKLKYITGIKDRREGLNQSIYLSLDSIYHFKYFEIFNNLLKCINYVFYKYYSKAILIIRRMHYETHSLTSHIHQALTLKLSAGRNSLLQWTHSGSKITDLLTCHSFSNHRIKIKIFKKIKIF